MAAHRYWALSMFARPGSGNGVGVAEVEMRGSPGGADLCTAGTASGTSHFGLLAANAFDNDDATIWHNASAFGEPARLSYDFGSAVDIVEIFVRNAPAGSTQGLPGATYGPGLVRVEWSDDGTNWFIGTPTAVLSSLGNGDTYLLAGVSDAPPIGRVLSVSTLSAYAPTWPVTPRVEQPIVLTPLANFGASSLSGVVDYITSPAAGRTVRAYDKASGRLLRETTTAGDGTYSFPDLIGGRDYYVVALDTPPNPASAWDTDISPIVQAT